MSAALAHAMTSPEHTPSPSLRVLMTTDTVGGVWNYALELAEALVARGVAVGLATMGALLTISQRRELVALPQVMVFESAFRLEWMHDAWGDVAAAGDWLLDVAAAFKPDVVHLNNYAHALFDWGVPTLVVAHSCVLSWWQSVRGVPAPPEWNSYARVVRTALHTTSLVVAPTYAMLDAVLAHYGADVAGEVIANGRSVGLYRPRPKAPLILTVGRIWDEAKNTAALIAAAPRVRAGWQLCIAGETRHPDGGTLQFDGALVRTLGVLSSDRLSDWYGRAAIYALPARYEPFGLSVLEAALAGCALVLGDLSSLRENWDGAALFVPPDDVNALAAALNTLINDDALRQRLGEHARRRAQRFSPNAMVNGYLSVYRRLTGQAHTSAAQV